MACCLRSRFGIASELYWQQTFDSRRSVGISIGTAQRLRPRSMIVKDRRISCGYYLRVYIIEYEGVRVKQKAGGRLMRFQIGNLAPTLARNARMSTPSGGSADVLARCPLPKVSESYAADIRVGQHRPLPRHWQALAKIVGIPDRQS